MSGLPPLVHFSDKPVCRVRSTAQRGAYEFKPAGFWVSVEGNGDGWSDWCQSEEFGLSCLAVAHDVMLRPEARILWLRTAEQIDGFTEKYLVSGPGFSTVGWHAVAKEYQGILITPYCWARRLTRHTRWYYGWDCASGCIWDAKAIERISVIERRSLSLSPTGARADAGGA